MLVLESSEELGELIAFFNVTQFDLMAPYLGTSNSSGRESRCHALIPQLLGIVPLRKGSATSCHPSS